MPGLKNKKDRKREEVGHVIDCGHKAYRIERQLGFGGYGDVYMVHLTKDREKKYVMKTERFDESEEGRKRIRVEINVLEAIQGEIEKDIDKTHFARLFITGRAPEYRFLIMQLVGPSLYDIRKIMMKGFTSPRTIAEIARQTLRPMESLHELGWLHRNVGPHNFAIGLSPKEATILMMHFGIARRFRDKEGEIRQPRPKVLCTGTMRYASSRAYKGEEQARRDDVESWCFMMMEYYHRNNLLYSWGDYGKHMIVAIKRKIMTESAEMRDKGELEMPKGFIEILTMTSELTFVESPNYARIHGILEEIIKDEKIDMSDPLDWIGKSMEMDPATIEKKEPDQVDEVESPNERELQRKLVRRTLAARKRELEKEMMELYKKCGKPKTLGEVREEMRRKKNGKWTEADEEGNNYSDDDSEGFQRPPISPLLPKHRHRENSDRHRTGEKKGRKEETKDKDRDRSKTPPPKFVEKKSDEIGKPKEKEEDGKRGRTNEVGNKKAHRSPRKKTTESNDELEKVIGKGKTAKKPSTEEKTDDVKALGQRLPLSREKKKGRTTASSEEKIESPKGGKNLSNEKVEKAGKKSDEKEKPSPVKSPGATKVADVKKKESVDAKNK